MTIYTIYTPKHQISVDKIKFLTYYIEMSNFKSKKGIANLAIIVIIAAGALLVVPTFKVLKDTFNLFPSDTTAKKQVVQLTTDQQNAQVADKQAAADRSTAATNQKNLDQAKQARLDIAHQDVKGTGFALAKESNPSANVKVAIVLNNDADNALDPIDQPKIDAMKKLVSDLTSQNANDKATGQKQLDDLNNQLTIERGKEATLTNQQVALNNQVTLSEAKASKLTDQVTTDSNSLKKWASDNASLLSRIGNLTLWIGILIGVMILFHWLLPLIGLAFPAVAPISKFFAAIIAYPLHALHTAEKDVISKAKTEIESLLSKTQTQLSSEQAAHAQTQATLLKVATTP